jgi:trans-aconitate 2-methyltransferase
MLSGVSRSAPMQRRPEPELMDEAQQALAYAEADFSRTDQALVESILHRLQASSLSVKNVVDLGCGPGNISFRLAEALPSRPLLAIDGAAAMLAPALRRQQAEPGRWPGLRFLQACLPLEDGVLSGLPLPFQPPFQLLISNSLLHHLHQPEVLWRAVRELGAPGSLVVVRDLRRPDSPAALEALVARHVSAAPAVLQRDYRASLQAAFRPDEVEEQLRQAGLSCLRVQAVEDRYLDVSGQLD